LRVSGALLLIHLETYICDIGNYAVRKISRNGIVVTVAGSTFGDMDGPGEFAKFDAILGLAQDSGGALYLTQSHGPIRKIVID